MQRGALFSLLLHGLLLIAVVVGMPELFQRTFPKPPPVAVVEILPISDITNVKPTTTRTKPKEKPKKPAKEPKPEPVKPKPKKTPTPAPKKTPKPPAEKPKVKPDRTPPPPEAVRPVSKPKPPKKPLEKKIEQPKKPAPKPKQKEKPKPEKKVMTEEEEFALLMNKMKEKQQEREAQDTQPGAKEADRTTKSQYDASRPLSISEIDAIRRAIHDQVQPNWNVLGGARNAYSLAVRVVIYLQPDGSVTKVEVTNSMRYNSDAHFRAMADRAVQAVWKSTPLRNLPRDRYEHWKEIEFNFDPRELLY